MAGMAMCLQGRWQRRAGSGQVAAQGRRGRWQRVAGMAGVCVAGVCMAGGITGQAAARTRVMALTGGEAPVAVCGGSAGHL